MMESSRIIKSLKDLSAPERLNVSYLKFNGSQGRCPGGERVSCALGSLPPSLFHFVAPGLGMAHTPVGNLLTWKAALL